MPKSPGQESEIPKTLEKSGYGSKKFPYKFIDANFPEALLFMTNMNTNEDAKEDEIRYKQQKIYFHWGSPASKENLYI